MVKKKTPEQEEQKHKKQTETADNKENNNTQEISDKEKSDIPPVTDQESLVTETSAPEGIVSDKVVAEEKSAEEKLAEMQDKYLRLSAEFDNYRKRTLREKMELSKYASEDILLKILPVMDDFERALSLMNTVTDCVAMKNGIDLIYVKFNEFLKQNGVKEIESLNCDFNFNLHDAVAKVTVQEDEKKGKIIEVIQKGYYLKDKIIRHSKVVVGE
ncbi:MAG: nucleotide exchange factor GrpE [Bacteroidales bacterium]|nr:nucleotide exchange factor GrpE [Bacteroidales bacterium]